ncbi:sugar ABC transporter permease [Brachybacterium phenoliresistens]|uniref:Sugar ABC transporter permease n=1 Tax=Brachybacterium phenoliresistens TaxID=396014 RepID=Z9JWY9_9MICO|nr:ABC transporter permease subunit [Brachybacterium phenoliresistens]EWS82302.1 sugar ABC transporter permease [Brachybacterium phenoliresistens]
MSSSPTAPATTAAPPTARARRRPAARWSLGLILLAVPGILYFLVMNYAPMAGLVVAFKEFDVSQGIFGSPWNGLRNFEYFIATGSAPRILWNTVFLNTLFLASTLVVGIVLAIMLNEIRLSIYKRTMQSAIFFPYFVSPVVISVILQVLLAGVGGQSGAVNDMLSVFSLPQVSWYSEPGPWPVILTIVKVWQLGGYQSVIFLAAITSISEETYEAAAIDGATRAQMAWHITVPMLRPTIAILVILGVGRIFYGDFGTIYAIVGDNGLLFPTTDVIDTYVFRALRTLGDFGTTAAVGLFQSVVGLLFVLGALQLQRRFAKDTSVL